jgi:hypothetical protein
MPQSRPTIGSSFHKHSRVQYPDLGEVRRRPAAGLGFDVRNSFAEEIVTEDGVGVVGWSFSQNGLNYACQIKDENNNDVYGFGVEVPKGQPYLHPSPQMGIAERAHVIAMIEQMLSPDKRQQHRNAFHELEMKCFDPTPSSGIVREAPLATPKNFVSKGHLTGYCGLVFANDADFLKPAEPAVLALEWEMDGKKYFIDCSGAIPRFKMGYASNPHNAPMYNMTRSEAKNAVDYARAKINMTDVQLSRICGITGLWSRLEVTADWLSMVRQP